MYKIEMWMLYAIAIRESTERFKMRFSWCLFYRFLCYWYLKIWFVYNLNGHKAFNRNWQPSCLFGKCCGFYAAERTPIFVILKSNIDDDDDDDGETQFIRRLLLLLFRFINKSLFVGSLDDKYIAAWYKILITIKNSQINNIFFVCRNLAVSLSIEWERVGFVLNHQVVRVLSLTQIYKIQSTYLFCGISTLITPNVIVAEYNYLFMRIISHIHMLSKGSKFSFGCLMPLSIL